jgi:hypothetical protein
MTLDEYREQAVYYSRLAEEAAPNSHSRYQFQTLADSYITLAKSTWVLERSAKAVESLEQRRRK